MSSPQELTLTQNPEELHALAIWCATMEQVNAVLTNPHCTEKTKNMLLAKIPLLKSSELAKVDKNPGQYHPDIVRAAQKKLKTG